MIFKRITILFLVWLFSITAVINAQTTRTVGSGGNYTTLRAAFVAINNGSITGAITLQIISGTTETGSNVLNASGTGSANYSSVTIYPTGSGYTINCNLAVPLIDLNGADHVTIDGRVNATGSAKDLILTNTNTGTSSATIRFINSAQNNTVKYCTIKGAETSTTKGVIFFSTATAGSGNDGNTIDNCNITCNAASRPLNGIYSAGTGSRENSENTISNNNIYDFLNRATASNGINLAGNTTAWNISDNSFYETTSFAPTAAVAYNALQINNAAGINFTVSGNYIGGKTAQCGSTAWTKTNTQNNTFTAINLNVGSITPSSVQNNTVQNLAWSNSGSAAFTGIDVTAGAVNIGTVSGNTIGAATGTGSILVTGGATGTNVYGIYIASVSTVDCQNNTIGSITAANAAANASNFYGISKTGAGTTTITNNTIGSTVTANSINAGSASTANEQKVLGIDAKGTGLISISNNTIANIKNGCTSSSVTNTIGIGTYSGSNTIAGNSIHDISCSSYVIAGIFQQSTAAGTNQTISDNTLYNLSNINASAIGGVYAIYYDGPVSGTNLITRNFIHSLNIASSDIGCSMDGIDLISGLVTCSNNIINLGVGITKTYMIYGIWDEGVAGQSNNIYYNTVYISGNPSGTTANTYAYNKKNNAGTSDIRNNIFVNARSGGTTGKHYAIVLAGLTGLTIDYNDYFVSGTGGVLGSIASVDKSTLAAWKLGTSQDANSLSIDPVFAVAGSTTATDYAPLSNLLAGITIPTIPTDYSLANRAGTPTIGAFEGTLSLNVDVYESGVLQSTYPRLKDAFDKINSGTHTGALELRVKANTAEIASAILYQSGYTGAGGTSNYSSITIYPTAAGVTLSGSFNASLIDLNGADNVTLDGRVNATGSASDLTIVNANTGSFASAVRFIISAENNTVKYCNINSSCYSAGVGVINFTSSTTGNGNDNNIIEYCNITNAGGNRPVNVIFSSGTAGRENSGNMIRNNNIFNFFNANSSSYGVNISNSSTDWTVSGNSFYETTTFVPAGAYKYYPLFINTGNNNNISNNSIGGSEPLCAGSAWTTIANFDHYFCGIYINGGLASSVVNNTIKNISYTSTEDNPWDGIFINSGNVNFTSNTLGATTGIGSITITTPIPAATTTISGGVVTAINLLYSGSGYTTPPLISFSTSGSTAPATAIAVISGGVVTAINLISGGTGYTAAPSVIFDGQSNGYSTSHGIIQNSIGTVTISNNNLGSINTVGSAWYSHGFETIYARSLGGVTTISNNLIGSLSTANSIQTSSTAVSALQKQEVHGIYGSGTGTTTISGNTVANLTNAYSGINSGSRARGIQTTAGSNTIQNNTVRNISTASGQNSSASSASVIGISQTSAAAGTTQTVIGNTIYDLSNTNAAAKVQIYGMYYAGPTIGTNSVSGNFVHGLSVSSTDIGAATNGIVINSGVVTCANNIINLGGSTIGYLINGIWDGTTSGSDVSFYFNTVYIGGTVSSGVTSETSALHNANNTSIRNYRNNILYNARTGGTSGKHYAIAIAGLAGLTIDYNNYFYAGTMLGKTGSLEKAGLAAWKLGTGQDANSLSIDPGFTIPGGTSVLNYFTSAILPGISGTGVETDYSGLTRGATPKMGALEANDYVWQGGTNTDFNTASNWTMGEVPPNGSDIAFAANPGNNCILDQNRTIGDITNAQVTDKLVVNGKQLTINGNLNFTNGAQIDATATSSVVVFAGDSAQSIPAGAFTSNIADGLNVNNNSGLMQNGDLTIPGTLTLTTGSFAIGANTLNLNGAIITSAGTLTGGSSTNISIGGSGANATLPSVLLNNLTLNRANGISLGGAVSVGGTLALTNGTLTLGANTLTISGSSPTRTIGFIDAGNDTATLAFTNTTAITLPASIFTGAVNNLTINGAGGITAISDFTVNGMLSLQSANASATKGSLDMWDGAANKTLTMGVNATTIGIGDVTGFVKRTAFIANTPFTFGNQFTSITFAASGTYPSQIQTKIIIGASPSWKTTAINRIYDFVQSGGSNCIATIATHYLDAELNGNLENELVQWTNGTPGPPLGLYDWGKSNSNSADNWVTIANINIDYFPTSSGQLENTLAKSAVVAYIWNGSHSTSWIDPDNWTPVGVPSSLSNVIIPDASTTPNDPELPIVTEIKSLAIEGGGILNSNLNSQLTINGGNGAWSNIGGTFNPNTSNVIFTNADATVSGTTNFYDVNIASGAGLTPGNNNIMRIANALIINGTGILSAVVLQNTIEYIGADQTVINPNGLTPGYHNLVLSGSGTKTMPGTSLSIAGDFTTSGTSTTTAGAAMTIEGNLTIGDGSAFNAGNFNHSIGGNFDNNGTFTASTGNTILMNGTSIQSIEGTNTTTLEGLTIDNSNGVNLLTNGNVNGTLTLTNGNLSVGLITLGINGTIDKTSGYMEVDPTASLIFGGTAALTIPNDLFTSPPSINNLTINRAGGVTLGNQDMTVNGLLDLQSGTFSLGANTLSIAGSSPTRTNGTIDAGNSGATLSFTNATAITLPASIFTGDVNNFNINGAGGVTASSDFTVNGILNLQGENPLTTKGSLDMWDGAASKILTMGASATTIGVGDVTGIVKRTSFVANIAYTYGNQFTTITLGAIGTLPSQIQVKISMGTSPSWKTTAINRIYDIIQTGGINCKATIAAHYSDNDLNGNIENTLVLWGYGTTPPLVGLIEFGRSNSNAADNWVSMANVPLGVFPSNFDEYQISLANSALASYTWNGSQSTSWVTTNNWTPSGIPSSNHKVTIPDASTTLYSPILPASTEIKNLIIEAGGVLNAVSNEQLTINGGNGAWSNAEGAFNPGVSKVIFTNAAATISGTTSFYDFTIATGAQLIPGTGNITRIAGTLTNNGILRSGFENNTIEFNGADQVVINPNGATPGYYNLILSGSGTKTMPGTALSVLGDFSMSGSASAAVGEVLSVGGNVTIEAGNTLNLGSFSHTIAGNLTNLGGVLTSLNSSITLNGIVLQTITSSGFAVNNLTIANTGANVTLGASTNCSIGGNLTINAGAVFDLAANSLATVTGSVSNAGTIKTQNTSSTPVPAGKTWEGYFEYTGTGAQTIVAGTYNNLTMSGSGGATADANITVNGILHLAAANPSATKGILDMGSNTVLMGSTATTIGQGDVTGIVRRTTILPNIAYSFGNEYTIIYFQNVGTLPSEISLKINIGTAPAWKPDAIKRFYDLIQTGGGGGTQTQIYSHYLNTELNGNDENSIVNWVWLVPYALAVEYGRSAFDADQNWVSIVDADIGFFSSSFGDIELTLGTSLSLALTWNGSFDASWVDANNWTPNAVPSDITAVTIPDAGTTDHDPTLPTLATCSTITLESGAILNATAGAELTLNGPAGAWNNIGGTFNAGNSKVTFTNAAATMAGSSDFYNINIDAAAILLLQSNTYLGITGTLSNNGIIRPVIGGATTIEYKGGDQTVVVPNPATNRYSTLILSGSGTKTMPITDLNIEVNFTMSGTATATAGADMTIIGNVTIGNGSAFITGNYNHSIGGNFENNGTFTATAGNTISLNGTSARSMGGTTTTTFDNLTLNNSHGVTLLTDEIINNALTLTSGNLSVGSTALGINGTISKTSGKIEVGTLSSLSFGGTEAITLSNDLFTSPPSLNNLTINRTGGVTLGNQNMTVNGLLDLSIGTLNLGANTLTIAGSSPVRTSGTIDAGNAGATLAFTNTTAITLPVSIFTGDVNNLTINGTGGVTAGSDFSLNGILNLQSDNPSSTKGILDMWDGSAMKILTMGANATTIGTGDVTGIIKRTTFIANTPYTFGNQFTTINLAAGGTYPSQIQAKISTGTSPSWMTTAINRIYEFTQTGGINCNATLTTHYLDAEFNGNTENKLVLWGYGTSPPLIGLKEFGRSNSNNADNWVSIANVPLWLFPSNFGIYQISLANSALASYTWNGSQSTSWITTNNWTPSGIPSSIHEVIIPDAATTLNSPTLPASTEIKTLTIEAAAILNAIASEQFTINGDNGAWSNADGTFNAGNSNVIFTNASATISGITDFYDVTINSGAALSMIIGSIMGIAGTMNNLGTWHTEVGGTTIVDYNGGNQVVVVPNPLTNRYNTLILSGSGVKTMPATALNIVEDFSMSGTASAILNAALTVAGNLTIESGNVLVVSPVGYLMVTGTLANNADNAGLVLQSDATGTASLMHNTNDVPATVQRYISGNAEAWHFLSSPVSDQPISGSWLPSGTYGNGTGYDLYLWNEPNSCWIYQLDITSPVNWSTVHPGADFAVGRGYLYSVQATNPTKEFVGKLNNGPLDYELTFSGTEASLKGFNLVGNPYPSSIDWGVALGWTRTALNSSGGGYNMWIWNPTASNYGVYNSSDADGTGTNSVTRYIAPMQGYFVQAANAGNLSMDNGVRVHEGAGNWFKSTEQEVSQVSLIVKSDAGYGFDEIQLGFGYAANENGAIKLFSKILSAPSLYMASEGDFLSVLYLTNTEENTALPVRFTPGMNGRYTLTCNSGIDKFETVVLEDRKSHVIRDMKVENSYSFTALKTDDADRFVLHFGPVNTPASDELPAGIYIGGSGLVIDLKLISKETDVLIYDMLGRLILQQKLQGEIEHNLSIPTFTQILVVYLKNPDGSLSQKVLWEGNQSP